MRGPDNCSKRKRRWWRTGGVLVVVMCGGIAAGLWCLPRPIQVKQAIDLHDVTSQSGVDFVHTDGGCGQRYIMETVSAGLALFDFDGDNDVDIYFLNGAPLKDCQPRGTAGHALYRNDGNCRFTDVTRAAGIVTNAFGLGVVAGDFNSDGCLDVYLNNFGPNVLYRNNGDGTFTDVTAEAGVDNGAQVGAGANFLDMDADGDLDLFAASYLKFSYETHVVPSPNGVPIYASPEHYAEVPDTLFRNEGDGTFSDVSSESGIGRHSGWGMGTVCADYDNDRDTDVFVANDVSENFLFENDGSGHFTEVGLAAGVAYDVFGSPQGSMGVDCGDYDNDGLLDFYQTSYQMQHAVLYHNLGGGLFQDVSHATGAGEGTFAHVTWGTTFADFDNDGDRDLYVACGHLQDNVELYDGTTSYLARSLVLMNTGDGHFRNVSDAAGNGLQLRRSSRGAAFDDLDNDGDVDVVMLNSRMAPTVLRNDSPADNHWLDIQLHGVRGNRDGVGAHVTVFTPAGSQLAEVHAGRGYQSSYGTRLHFGLGRQRQIERIEVRWIGGRTSVLTAIAADQQIALIEGDANPTTIHR